MRRERKMEGRSRKCRRRGYQGPYYFVHCNSQPQGTDGLDRGCRSTATQRRVTRRLSTASN